MQRIMIFGLPGSGKSTLAVELGQRLGLPVYHLDRYFYVANWVERPSEEFLAIQEDLVGKERWVIDGNARRSLEMRYARADMAIYVRCNQLVCLWRLWKRALRPDTEIEDLPEGCTKSVRWRLIRYMWTFHRHIRPILGHLRERYPGVKFVELRTTREIRQFSESTSAAA